MVNLKIYSNQILFPLLNFFFTDTNLHFIMVQTEDTEIWPLQIISKQTQVLKAEPARSL